MQYIKLDGEKFKEDYSIRKGIMMTGQDLLLTIAVGPYTIVFALTQDALAETKIQQRVMSPNYWDMSQWATIADKDVDDTIKEILAHPFKVTIYDREVIHMVSPCSGYNGTEGVIMFKDVYDFIMNAFTTTNAQRIMASKNHLAKEIRVQYTNEHLFDADKYLDEVIINKLKADFNNEN